MGVGAISLKTPGGATSPGSLTVFFEPPSCIRFIGDYGIERKEEIIVFFGGAAAPSFSSHPFFEVSHVFVYSPVSVTFGGVPSIVDPSLSQCSFQSMDLKPLIAHFSQCSEFLTPSSSIIRSEFLRSKFKTYFYFFPFFFFEFTLFRRIRFEYSVFLLNDSHSTRYSSLQVICWERWSNICLMLPN
jgi:hypothetical protein